MVTFEDLRGSHCIEMWKERNDCDKVDCRQQRHCDVASSTERVWEQSRLKAVPSLQNEVREASMIMIRDEDQAGEDDGEVDNLAAVEAGSESSVAILSLKAEKSTINKLRMSLEFQFSVGSPD